MTQTILNQKEASNRTTPQDELDRLLTVPEAARLLHLSPGSLYHMIGERRVPVIRISSRCVRFSHRALLDWLDSLSQSADELVGNSRQMKAGKEVKGDEG